ETLVADLAPHSARAPAHRSGNDDAGREDQTDDATRDRASLRPLLAARIGGFLELDLAVACVDDDGRVDQVDRALPLCRLEILGGGSSPVLRGVRRNEELHCSRAHSSLLCLVGQPISSKFSIMVLALYIAHSI